MKLPLNLTLGKKLTLMTALILVLTVGVLSFLGLRAVHQATEAMLEDRLTTASLVANHLDEVLERALTELKNTANGIDIDAANGDFAPQIESLEDTYYRLSIRVHSSYLLNEQGQIILSRPETATIETPDISYYPIIKQAISRGEPGISGLVAPFTDVPVVFLVSPTKETQQGSRGVLAVAIDPAQSSISGFAQTLRLGETGYIEIIDQNGLVVGRTEPGPTHTPFERSDHSDRFAELIAAGEPARGLCHTCHEPVMKVERKDVIAFVPLREAYWGVVVRQSEEEALAAIHDLRQSVLFFGVGLVAFTILLVTATTRDVVSRLQLLTSASQKIAEGDLVSPVTVSRGDEIGILARTLDDMRTKLKTAYGYLEQRTEELSSLLSVSEILASLSDLSNLDTALSNALGRTLEVMRQDVGGILLLDEERQMLSYRVHHGFSKEYVEGISCRLGDGIAGRVAQTGEAILIDDISRDPRTAHPDLINMEGLRSFACVPICFKDKILGVINIASRQVCDFSLQDTRLLENIAQQIAVAIENARLHQEVQRKEKVRGELLQEIISTQEEERQRIARELHDETSQALASITANLEAATFRLPADDAKTRGILRKAQDLSISILDEIHRFIYELRPTLLDDLGLVAALRWLAENKLGGEGINVYFKTIGRERRLHPQLETTIFRVVQEAISNIAKHAHAKSATIILRFKKSLIRIQVKDDGKGFNIEEALSLKHRPSGLGLLGMKERIELFNGTLRIMTCPSRGTEVIIEIPTGSGGHNGQNKSTSGLQKQV